MQPTIPELTSRYIPVLALYFSKHSHVHWWKDSSDFIYPNVLINLMTTTAEDINAEQIHDKNCFLLVDSGGFQVISGQCNIDWKESVDIQVKLGATKIFSFDKPPVTRKTKGQNTFIYMKEDAVKKTIKENFDVAVKQSKYLKDTYPEYHDRFCYILHGKNKRHWDYNMQLIKETLGGSDGYDKCFPGGITYAIKNNDPLTLAIASSHAKKYFIDRGKYVHFLGCGSFNKMLVLIRNKITTFDSSTALRGAITWTAINPIQCNNTFTSGKENYCFDKGFCICPTCLKYDYLEIIKKDNPTMYGRQLVKHNLWHMLKINIFLDAIKKDRYTEIVKENFKLNEKVLQALEFIDYSDKNGFEVAYEKYKPHLEKDETKQETLF